MNVLERLKKLDPRIGYAVLGLGGGVLVFALMRRAREQRLAASGPSLAELPGYARSAATIANLDPIIRPYAEKLLVRAAKDGIRLVVVSGYRSIAEQDKLYAQGRTDPGPKVTNAKGGSSWHNFALAFDVASIDESGNIFWPNDSSFWSKVGQLGKEVGLEWGGDWVDFQDRPHFQYRGGLTLADARAGKKPTLTVA